MGDYKLVHKGQWHDNAEIKNFNVPAVRLQYDNDEDTAIRMPIPKDGETIQTDIKVSAGGFAYKISEVRRNGNIIYYDDNCTLKTTKVYCRDVPESNRGREMMNKMGDSDYEKAIANQEALLESVVLVPAENHENEIYSFGHGAFWIYDGNAQKVDLLLKSLVIVQYGNFNISFD
jgi:hypothetical protein